MAELAPLPLFRSGHLGFGQSDATGAGQNEAYRYNRTHRSADMRWAGELRPGVSIDWTAWDSSLNFANPPVAAVEWVDPSGNPLILISGDRKTISIQYGIPTADTTLISDVTDGVMHDDGSGVPYYYTCYTGTFGAGGFVERRGVTAPPSLQTCTFRAQKLLSLGNDLYIAHQKSASNNIASCVGKIDAGTNPLTAAQPSMTPVGQSHQPINRLAAIGRIPVALKPEGVFIFDRGIDDWVNLARWMEAAPHKDNGKTFWYEGTDLIIALGAGGAIRCDGNTTYPHDPLPIDNSHPSAGTTGQLISAGGSLRHWGLAVTSMSTKRTGAGGAGTAVQANTALVFARSDDAGVTYPTNYATQVKDYDPTTVATLSALPVTNGYILIGFPEPFVGVKWTFPVPNSNPATMVAEISTGTSSFTAIDIDDLTVDDNAISVGRPAGAYGADGKSGTISFSSDPMLTPWTSYAITASSFNTTPRYWLRLSWTATLSATVQVSHQDLIPYQAGIGGLAEGIPVPIFSGDWADRSGLHPHILASRINGAGERVVHDMGSIATPDEISQVLYTSVGVTGTNDARLPLLIGKRGWAVMKMAQDDRPHLMDWPIISTLGYVEFGITDLERISGKVGPFRIKRFIVDCENWSGKGLLYYRWDDGTAWSHLDFGDGYGELEVSKGASVGTQLAYAVGWSGLDAQAPGAPKVNWIDVVIEQQEGKKRRLPRQSPVII